MLARALALPIEERSLLGTLLCHCLRFPNVLIFLLFATHYFCVHQCIKKATHAYPGKHTID